MTTITWYTGWGKSSFAVVHVESNATTNEQ